MKISVNNKIKVRTELDLTQKGCSVRMLTVNDISDIVVEAEEYLSNILYKKRLERCCREVSLWGSFFLIVLKEFNGYIN